MGIYLESGSKYENVRPGACSLIVYVHRFSAVFMCPRLIFSLVPGISHVLERLAFKGTQNRTPFRLTREARDGADSAAP